MGQCPKLQNIALERIDGPLRVHQINVDAPSVLHVVFSPQTTDALIASPPGTGLSPEQGFSRPRGQFLGLVVRRPNGRHQQ
jgi:hypothetical protein